MRNKPETTSSVLGFGGDFARAGLEPSFERSSRRDKTADKVDRAGEIVQASILRSIGNERWPGSGRTSAWLRRATAGLGERRAATRVPRDAAALMPPPAPRPQQRARKQKVLDEDEWTERLDAIITRDYFPHVPRLKNKLEWIEARNSGDPEQMRRARRRTSSGGSATPSAPREGSWTPRRSAEQR